MLPLLVGEAPNRSGGVGAGRLSVYGLEFVNLLDVWPGAQEAGSAFPLARAVPAAEALDASQPSGRRFILLGTRVASAFRLGRHRYRYLEWLDRGVREVAVVPHPSGLNRWWNSEENCAAADVFFREGQHDRR